MMSKNKRKSKYWKQRLGNLTAERMQPYYHQLDLRFLTNLDDEMFEYLLTNVKGVYMLDLNETNITNESIKLLPKLEYVNEIRAKEIPGLTNDCIDDLNNIKDLRYLHVKNTNITIDGLLKLDKPSLDTLLFSATNVEAINDKLLQLRILQPNCEFIIDGKTHYFDDETIGNL
jgi:hypothetical protein